MKTVTVLITKKRIFFAKVMEQRKNSILILGNELINYQGRLTDRVCARVCVCVCTCVPAALWRGYT